MRKRIVPFLINQIEIMNIRIWYTPSNDGSGSGGIGGVLRGTYLYKLPVCLLPQEHPLGSPGPALVWTPL